MTPHTSLSSSMGLSGLIARARRVRLASLTVGAMIGMAAVAYLPPAAHAAPAGDAPAKAAPVRDAAKATATKTSKRAAKRAATKTKKAAAVIAATQLVPLPEASAEQLSAAERVLIGRYECEFKKTILVDRNDKNPGYVNLTLGKQSWVTKPVLSSTGAIRLEDTESEILLLQILTKSMVMNIKTGQRVVDGCVHEVQRAAEEELGKKPRSPSFFGAPEAASAPAAPQP
ncbi:MAG: hypothetical protein EOP40_13385 [Rubrivivax sp.]|nr:MAG: hypothetical protein EOP40_13385 [Rubrivivax sp.]